MIKANIVAHSTAWHKQEIASLEVVMPRIVLAEFNTHRVFSRNSASSRAIPFPKALRSVLKNSFIPIAFQKNHSGMQGSEYFDPNEKFHVDKVRAILMDTLVKALQDDKTEEVHGENGEDREMLMTMFNNIILSFGGYHTLTEFWLMIRDKVVEAAVLLYSLGVTKQLCNRLLEPFMYHTVLVTSTEWENFFQLRCPVYTVVSNYVRVGTEEPAWRDTYRSRKEFIQATQMKSLNGIPTDELTDLDWLRSNKGTAEIHIMAVAEAIYDAIRESAPTFLYPGDWHIVYRNKIDGNKIDDAIGRKGEVFADGEYNRLYQEMLLKVSTGMGARTSYTTVGDEKEVSYTTLAGIHDKMLISKPFHASPFEHDAQVMTEGEYNVDAMGFTLSAINEGKSRNFKGFKQYREILEDAERNKLPH